MTLDREARRRIASSTPESLLKQWSFWRRQRTFFLVVAVGVAMVIVLAPYTYGSGETWEWLSVAVQGLAVWGIVIAARTTASLEVETALAAEIDAEGSTYLSAIKAKRRTHVDLDRLEETLVPNNPSQPPPAMIRLFQNICKEARDRRFDSAVSLMQPHREEALEDLFRLQNLQKIALWLGILGTFVGMLIALQSGNVTQFEGGEAFLRIVQRMFDGLFVSFTASVAGLEVAVILGFLQLLVRRQQETYFSVMESAVVTMLSAARHAINQDDFFNEFGQVNTAVRDLTTRVYEQTQELGAKLRSLRTAVDTQNTRIGDGLNKLANANAQFDGFLKSISDVQRQFLDDLRNVYAALSLKTFAAALENGVKEAGREVSNQLTATTSETTAQLAALNTSIAELRAVGQMQSREFGVAMKELMISMTTALGEHTRAVTSAHAQLQSDAARQRSTTESIVSQLSAVSGRLSELNRTLAAVGHAPLRRRSFWEAVRLVIWGERH